MKQTKLRYLGFTLAAVLAMLLIGLSFSRFGQHKRPTTSVNKPLIVRPAQAEPPAVKLPPPTASDVVHAVEADLFDALLHAGLVEHGLQRHASPARVSHCAVAQLAAGHAGIEKAAAVARALIDRNQFDRGQLLEILQ